MAEVVWDPAARKVVADGKGLTSSAGAAVCKQVTTLSLQHNELQALEGLHQCRNLKVLNVSHNKLTSLSGILQNPPLDCLNALIATDNHIASVAGLGALCRLNTLIISNNPLGDITPISGMKWLCKLTMSGCGLTTFPWKPPQPNRFDKLVELRLNRNHITHVDPSIGASSKLVLLDLGNNAITDADSTITALVPLTALENLNLKGNPVDTAPFQPRVEEACPKLWYYNYRPSTRNARAENRKKFKEAYHQRTKPRESTPNPPPEDVLDSKTLWVPPTTAALSPAAEKGASAKKRPAPSASPAPVAEEQEPRPKKGRRARAEVAEAAPPAAVIKKTSEQLLALLQPKQPSAW